MLLGMATLQVSVTDRQLSSSHINRHRFLRLTAAGGPDTDGQKMALKGFVRQVVIAKLLQLLQILFFAAICILLLAHSFGGPIAVGRKSALRKRFRRQW